MQVNQDVYNEKLNPSSNIITTKWVALVGHDSNWTHRNIEYNNAGVPILRLYPNEDKYIYKEVYVNGIRDINFEQIYSTDIITLTCDKKNPEGHTETLTAVYENQYIVSEDIGFQAYLPANQVSTFADDIKLKYTIIEKDLLIIVDDEPKVVNIKWNYDNPLILSDNKDIELIETYANGDSHLVSITKLYDINFISSNIHVLDIAVQYNVGINDVNRLYFDVHNYDEKCKVFVDYESLKNIFGENINRIEPLTIITINELNPSMLLDADFKFYYDTQIPMIGIGDNYQISIKGRYTFTDNSFITYNYNDIYVFDSDDEGIALVSNNVITGVSIGSAIITAMSSSIDDTYSDIPKTINWNVRIIKTLDHIEWNINGSENRDLRLNIGQDEATINVIAFYSDGSEEDISQTCSFYYDHNIVLVDGNIITPLVPGETDFYILSSTQSGDIDPDKIYKIKVLQPIEDIDIEEKDVEEITLDETELELYVGTVKKLTYKIYPSDATIKNVVWMSTNDNIVSVDNLGNIKVLKKGYARIYVGVIIDEAKIPNEEVLSEEQIIEIYSDVYTWCDINALEIKVTGIKTNVQDIVCYVGGDPIEYKYTIEPPNASNKEITVDYIGNERTNCISVDSDEPTIIYPLRQGSGILKVISVDNPEIFTEIKIKCVDNRVKKIIVNKGNDSDYEWYDDFTVSPEVVKYASKTATDKIETNELWDDDDFPRYYCPLNNSLQLSARVLPSGAQFSDLIWYSSDGELVKCTENGIITPIRLGSQKLDMYGDDDENDKGRRFPNTTWITAFNKKGNVAGVCQVRTTKNIITGISIGEFAEHDYDIDVMDPPDYQDLKSEYINLHDSDYDIVMYRNDEVVLPITLSLQDPNFGASNDLTWLGNTLFGCGDYSWSEIIELSNNHVSISNTESDFDWSATTPAQVNNAKKNLNVHIKGNGIGGVSFYAKSNESYYAPTQTASGVTGDRDAGFEPGHAIVGDYDVFVTYSGYIKDVIGELNPVKEVKVVNDASVTLNENNQIFVSVPSLYYKDVLNKPYEEFIDGTYKEDCNHVKVIITNKDTHSPEIGITVLIEANRNVNRKQQSLSKTDENGFVFNPSPNNEDINLTAGYLINSARPGQGEYKSAVQSRQIKVKVVDKPDKIYVTLRSVNRVKGGYSFYHAKPCIVRNQTLIIKYSSTRTIPCFIEFDDDFIDRLNDYSRDDKCPLEDKYMSYAWFTSDPNIFVPIEVSQLPSDSPDIYIPDEFIEPRTIGGQTVYIKHFNLKGYGRYMHIKPMNKGIATLTVVNISSGQIFEAKIKVED